MMFMYFLWILWTCCLNLDFYGFPSPWDHFDPVRIKHLLKMPQDLRQIVEYCPKLRQRLFGNMDFDTSVKPFRLCYGFKRTRVGQNVRNDRGIISGFHQKSDFDPCVAGRSPCFPKKLDVHVLPLNN